MIMASRKDRLKIYTLEDVPVLDLGEMDIWDGADLSLLRETLNRLITEEHHTAVGISLHHVKYIPSGFFGMLYDWHDQGIAVYLHSPQENVAQMLWFRKFFEHAGGDCHRLRPAREEVLPGVPDEWHRPAFPKPARQRAGRWHIPAPSCC